MNRAFFNQQVAAKFERGAQNCAIQLPALPPQHSNSAKTSA
jgi:hypothetical protein